MYKSFILFVSIIVIGAFGVEAAENYGSLGAAGGQMPSAAGASGGGGDAAKFAGGYFGANVNVIHNNAKIESRSFSGTGVSAGLYGGYGWAFKKVYGSAELEVNYGSVKTTKDTNYKLRSTYDVGLAGRVGMVVKGSYLPYFRLGLGLHGYNYYISNKKNQFNTFFIAPGVGFEALLGSFMMRIEAGYSIPMSTGGISKTKIQRKPNRAYVKLGGAYKF